MSGRRGRPADHGPPVEVTTGPLVAGGRCLAHLDDGTALFVAGAAPDERVRVAIERRRARVAEGRVVAVIEGSPARVEPPCRWADRCGGCDWMHLDAATQREAKGALIDAAARRQAGVERPAAGPVAASPEVLGYRGRVRLHVDRDGQIGYFARGTHRVVAIDRCAVARPAVGEALATLREAVGGAAGAFGAEVSGVELREGDDDAPWAVHLFPRERRAAPSARLRAIATPLAARDGAVWFGGRVLHGPARLRYPIGDGRFLLAGPLAFVQANPGANRALVAAVVAAARALAGDGGTFVDLFCGAGNFTLPLLAAGLDGVGIELSASAIADGRAAAAAQGLDPAALVAGRAERASFDRFADRRPDVLLLDPPRTGHRQLADTVARLRPRAVLYVACDPVTQARDLRPLLEGGAALAGWDGADLFPQTHHVEAIARLRLDPIADRG